MASAFGLAVGPEGVGPHAPLVGHCRLSVVRCPNSRTSPLSRESFSVGAKYFLPNTNLVSRSARIISARTSPLLPYRPSGTWPSRRFLSHSPGIVSLSPAGALRRLMWR